MFWNKKEVKVDGLPITLSIRNADYFTGVFTRHFLAYKYRNEWRKLVEYDQFRSEMDDIRKKQELILDHLKLKYVPETKEPAKLVENTFDLSVHFKEWLAGGGHTFHDYSPLKPTPKKRGRPKKK